MCYKIIYAVGIVGEIRTKALNLEARRKAGSGALNDN